MTTTARLDEMKKAWSARRRARQADPNRSEQIKLILSELAKGQPVTTALAADLLGLEEDSVASYFADAAEMGAEINEDGAMVGNALTLQPTNHKFRVNGNNLYAWCAFDTLFLSGLIGQPASVESRDPVNGETITLEVIPDGVRSYKPESAVASVVVPGETPSCDIDAKSGPESAACTQMNFFATTDTAEKWVDDHPGVRIVHIEQAADLARTVVDNPCSCC